MREQLQSNWLKIIESVHEACQHSSRPFDSVCIVGITKYVDIATTQAVIDLGCRDIGESRPQSLWQKHSQLSSNDVRWHLVGHLQRNKVRRTLPLIHLIHSVDSLRLIQQIADDASSLNLIASILLEVNVTNDTTKTGARPDELSEMIEACLQSPSIRLQGLMGMASVDGDLVQARKEFAAIRELRDQSAIQWSHSFPILSMGMSGDYREAIAEGSTMIRIGSSLFEGIAR